MVRNYQFTEETQDLISDLEAKSKRKKIIEREITKEQLDFIDILIKRYNEAYAELVDRRKYRRVCIYGHRYLIPPKMTREIKEVIKAVNKNSFDNRAEYKYFVESGVVKRKKTFKPYRIQRLARMLKVVKEADYSLFESFIKIPDVYYTLNVIKSNTFGDLDKYLGVKSG